MRVRDQLDQGDELALHRLILDRGVGTQYSQTRSAVKKQQALDILSVNVAVIEKRYVDTERIGNDSACARQKPGWRPFRIFALAES